jgi:predicted  nucleic acid-binding Zn-ribbon protein|tara:strand:- start:3548 stop:3979 length:432 start_codon:yes stop_codon:yes gene_type:complete
MDFKIRNEIIRLKNAKEMYQGTYLEKLEDYDEKVMRLESQIERATSGVKREILEKQKTFYLNEIEKIDKTVESTTKFIDSKLENLNKQLKNIDNEKKSFDYNIIKLKKAVERRNVNEIFDMFEYISNALCVLNGEVSRTPEQS